MNLWEGQGCHKVNNNQKKLIIAFQSDSLKSAKIIEWKNSLTRMEIDYDFLFIKDWSRKWYLGPVRNIGKNINHTIDFLKKQTSDYERVVCMGSSMGGYASILFGSLLCVDQVIAFSPQTDLFYAHGNRKKLWRIPNREKYNNLNEFICSSTNYLVSTRSDYSNKLHSLYHYENISNHKNVNWMEHGTTTMIKNGKLQKLLRSIN